MSLFGKKMAIFIMLAVFFISLDRFLKCLAVNFQPKLLWPKKLFQFYFTPNYYIAFSLPIKGFVLNIFIILVIVILSYYGLVFYQQRKVKKAGAIVIIMAGAASNLYDRLAYGYVIDYFDLKYFTVFNVADMMIVGGVVGLFWLLLALGKKKGG